MSDLTGGTRRVSVTHDGKRIGHTEPLDPESPLRRYLGTSASRANVRNYIARARKNGLPKAIVQAAQKRSATMRAK